MKRPTSAMALMVDRACGITDADYETDREPEDPRSPNDPERIAESCGCICNDRFAKAMDCARGRGNKTRCACVCHRPAVREARARIVAAQLRVDIEEAREDGKQVASTAADLRSVACTAGAEPALDPFDPSLVDWLESDDEAAFLFAGGLRLFCRACGCGLWAFGDAFPGLAVAAHFHPPSERG